MKRISVRFADDADLEFTSQDGYKWLFSSSQADELEPQSWHRYMGFEDCGIIYGINDNGISEVFFRIRTMKAGDY